MSKAYEFNQSKCITVQKARIKDLEEENKEWKSDAKYWGKTAEARLKEIDKLRKENEQLKSDNKCYVKRYSELFDDYIAYKKENEQLKQKNERLKQFRATTYSLINDYLIDAKRGVKQSYKEVLTEIKEILVDEEKGDVE